jgi:LPS O-antigen subunit length determinant protein (WzzB/FepE family)
LNSQSNHPYRYRNEQEIDLVELFQALWQQKLWVIGVAIFVTLAAAVYAFAATPWYETRSFLRPVPRSALDQLNETGIYELKPEDALARVASGLSSYDNRFEYFRHNEALFESVERSGGSLEQALSRFNEDSFAMILPKPNDANRGAYVGIQLRYPKGMDGVSIVNGFVEFVLQKEREAIASDLDGLIKNRLANLETKIEASRAHYQAEKDAEIAQLLEDNELARAKLQDELGALRAQAKVSRANRIQELAEAIAIAESLGIRKPTTPSGMAEAQRSGGQVIRTEVVGQNVPLYFMGTEALQAERETLQKRVSDDFMEPRIADIQGKLAMLEKNREVEILRARDGEDRYLQELAKLREEAAWLHGIKLDTSTLRLVRIDQPAQQPLAPVKPRKALILALGVVLGGMLGVFMALIRVLALRRPKNVTLSQG